MVRRVQFCEQAAEVASGQTWPRSALKCKSQPSAPSTTSRRRKQKVKAVVFDIYRGYRTLEDIDDRSLLHDIVKDEGDNALMTWTVLNMTLRAAEMRLQAQQSPDVNSETFPPTEVQIDFKDCVSLVHRASAHFDVFSQSVDVLDNRVLSQIMRTVELLWISAVREGYTSEISSGIDAFVERCIGLIRAKPNSKSLATTALRVINLVDWSLIGQERIAALLIALGKTQLAFATSFAAESILAYNTAAQLYPSVMTENQRHWVSVALRALSANSPLTRSQSLSLLQGCDEPSVMIEALNSPADITVNADALARTIARRMLAIIQVCSNEDAKVLMQAWCLVLKAVGEVDAKWQHLELWLDMAKLAFRVNTDASLSHWDSFLFISNLINRPDILLFPFNGAQLTPNQCSSLVESATKTFHVSELFWDSFLETVLKSLAQSKNEALLRVALQRMESALRPVRLWLGSNIGRVLNVCMVIFRNGASCLHQCTNVWRLLVESASSRPQAMELLRFHYKFLSLELPLSAALTSTLVETWSLKALTEKAKSGNHSLLSLTLLPITSFGTTSRRVEYIEKNIIAHFKNSNDIQSVLRVLLTTVVNNESQQSTQLERWSTVATVVLNVLPKSRERGCQNIYVESAALFANLFLSAATRKECDLWVRLVAALDSPDAVLSKIGTVATSEGFEALLALPASGPEKARIITDSLSDSKVALIKKAIKDGFVTQEFVENIAKLLMSRATQHNAPELALSLLPPARTFIIARPMLAAIAETHSSALVSLWNSKMVATVSACPPFVLKHQVAKIAQETPALQIPESIVVADNAVKREPETPLASEAKRPRRRILTGSKPLSLSTPPASSDPIEDHLASSADELCSSPPRNAPQPPLPSWQNAQDRARVLKRVIMGLNMQEAMDGMKRTECEMIYNLLFRACVDLHTHLSNTADAKPADEVEEARGKLQQVLELREKQDEAEAEEARLRQIKREADVESQYDDEELSDYDDDEMEDDEDEDYMKRAVKPAPALSAADRTLRLRA